MPKKRRPDLGRRTQSNVRRTTSRANRIDDQKETDQDKSRIAMSERRSLVSDNVVDRLRMQRVRAHQTKQQQARHNKIERICRRSALVILKRAAFHYGPAINYCADKPVTIGEMKIICEYCEALKYTGESTGLFCAGGKVKLPQLVPPPDPLSSLVSGIGNDSKHFLVNIQKYNNCFQMSSFGATRIIQYNFMPTFKIQGQIYHSLGTLLPLPDAGHQFLKIYIKGNSDAETNNRTQNPTVKRSIVQELQKFLHQNNNLVNMFKIEFDRMPSNSHDIIGAEKTPTGEHTRRFIAPTVHEVAVIIDIVFHRRKKDLKRVYETHKSYEALQYPLIFWQGEHGYPFNIETVYQVHTGAENKKVSEMNFYSYRLMICQVEANHILICQRLFHQFTIDIYVKIETELLTNIYHMYIIDIQL